MWGDGRPCHSTDIFENLLKSIGTLSMKNILNTHKTALSVVPEGSGTFTKAGHASLYPHTAGLRTLVYSS